MNEIMMNTRVQPTEYDFKRIAIQRKLITAADELKQFQRIESGVKGEQIFSDLMKQFGLKNWLFGRNVWLHDFSDFECDYLLLTNHCVYVFEIKHYFGKFTYNNGQCTSRGVDITYNPINQAHNATTHLRNLLPSVPVKGVLVFIGEHNQVQIQDEIGYIDILCRNDVYQYIQNMIATEYHAQTIIDSSYVISKLTNRAIDTPYPVVPYQPNQIAAQNAGIFCARCDKSLDWTRKNYIACTCGYHEYRDHLIVRTICEYGVLTYGTNFTVSGVHYILGNKLSYQYITKILRRYFKQVPNKQVLTFENKGLSQIENHKFDRPNKIILV